MAPHSSTLPWKIPWTEEPRRLLSMGSLWVRHDWATSLTLFTFMHWRRTWQPTPTSLPGKLQERGTWWAAVYGVAQSWTRLKWQLLLQQQQPSRGLHMSIWTLYMSSSAILRRHWLNRHWSCTKGGADLQSLPISHLVSMALPPWISFFTHV